MAEQGNSSSKLPKHPKYRDISARLESYVAWPSRYVPQTPESLAASGFFYIGSADRVTCFQCGITLRDWEDEHDPETEHKSSSKNCEFIHGTDLGQLGVTAKLDNGIALDCEFMHEIDSEFGGNACNTFPTSTAMSHFDCNSASEKVLPSKKSQPEAGLMVSRRETEEARSSLLDTKVQTMMSLGYPVEDINRVRERYIVTYGRDFPDAVSLFEELKRLTFTEALSDTNHMVGESVEVSRVSATVPVTVMIRRTRPWKRRTDDCGSRSFAGYASRRKTPFCFFPAVILSHAKTVSEMLSSEVCVERKS